MLGSFHHFPIHQTFSFAVKFNSQSDDFSLVAFERFCVTAIAYLLFGCNHAAVV